MNYKLLELDFSLFILFMFIFAFIFPIFLVFKSKRLLNIIYLIGYSIILFLGLFLDVKINYSSIYINLYFDNKWFNSPFIVASFSPLSLLINLFLLFPITSILPLLFKNITYIKIIILGFLTSLTIEFIQFALPINRYPELLDILNNTISAILGYIYYLILKSIRSGVNDKLSKQKAKR